MREQTSFNDRIARIEARASGRAPKLPVIAPMAGEDLRETVKRRGRLSRLVRRVVLPASVLGLGASLYSAELIALLPPDLAAQVVSRPGPLGDLVRAQMTPEQLAQLSVALPDPAPLAASN